MKKLVATVITLALAVAFGASAHRITLDKPAIIGGTELKPGDYRLELQGDKVTISNKKSSVDAAVHVETAAGDKFRSTTMCCLSDDGKYNLQEIRLGGTNQKLVISAEGPATK